MALLGALGWMPAAHAQGHVIMTAKLDWITAAHLAEEAVRACAAQGYSVTASVVDTTGHQQAVIKGDSVPLQSLSVSYRKAYTAYAYGLAFNMNTTSDLIAAKVTGPANGALNTIPEVLFVPGGVACAGWVIMWCWVALAYPVRRVAKRMKPARRRPSRNSGRTFINAGCPHVYGSPSITVGRSQPDAQVAVDMGVIIRSGIK